MMLYTISLAILSALLFCPRAPLVPQEQAPSCGAIVDFEFVSVVAWESGGNIPRSGGWFAVDGRSRDVELEKIFFAVEDPLVGEVWPNENGEFLILLVAASLDASLPLSFVSLDNGFELSKGEVVENDGFDDPNKLEDLGSEFENPLTLGCVTEASTGLLRFPNKSLVDLELLSVLPTIFPCNESWVWPPKRLFPACGLLGLLKRLVEGATPDPDLEGIGLKAPKRLLLCAGCEV